MEQKLHRKSIPGYNECPVCNKIKNDISIHKGTVKCKSCWDKHNSEEAGDISVEHKKGNNKQRASLKKRQAQPVVR